MSKLWVLCVFVLGCVFSNALGGIIAYYPLDDTWTGDSYNLDPKPEVTNLVGPNAVANRHMSIDSDTAMFGNCAYNPVSGSSNAGCVANAACRVPLNGDFTISGWGYVRGTATLYSTIAGQFIDGNSGRMALHIFSSNHGNKAAFQMGGSFVTGGSAMDDSLWHHIVGTKVQGSPNSTFTLYVDGVPVATRDLAAADVVNTDFTILRGTPMAPTDASVDDISVWDEALTEAQVAYLYDQGRNYGKSLGDLLNVQFTPSRMTLDEGDSTSYTVVLKKQPSVDVTVTMEPAIVDLGAGYGTAITRTFTPADWDVPQTVTVTTLEDSIVTGTLIDQVLVGVDPNTDPNYTLTDDIYITVVEDEQGLVLAGADSLVVSEEGATSDTFTVNLGVMPDGTATIDITANSQVTVSPAQLTFTTSDYMTPQTVTVTAVDDTNIEATPHTGTVTLTVTVGGVVVPLYGETVTVTVNENDCGAFGYATGDVNKDCKVNLTDFAAMAANWLECTFPADPTCVKAN